MQIISQDDRKIILQREEFIVNLNNSQFFATVVLIGLTILTLLSQTESARFKEISLWSIGRTDEANPLLIFLACFVVVFALGTLSILIFGELWQALKSPTRNRHWDQYTLDKEQGDISQSIYKWSSPFSLGRLTAIKDILLIVDADCESKDSDPESVNPNPTTLYRVFLVFEDDRQILLERNTCPLACSEKVQQLFRQTLTETNQAVLELRSFLGLGFAIDNSST